MLKNSTEKSGLPVVITTALVVATVTFIAGVVVGNQVPGTPLTQDSLSSWVSAVATALIGVLTFVLATETWRLRAAQTEQLAELRRENIRPNIGIELESSPVGVNFMNVKVSNFGKGIAKKIRFEFLDKHDKPVVTDVEPIVKVFQKLAMFRLGIESMGINQELNSFLFSFIELGKETGGKIFTPFVNIRIKFEDIEGNEYLNAFVIDFAQYEGISGLGGNDIHQMATELKAIREQLAKVIGNGSSNQRLSVDVFNSKDRQAEAEELNEWSEQQRGARQDALGSTEPNGERLPD